IIDRQHRIKGNEVSLREQEPSLTNCLTVQYGFVGINPFFYNLTEDPWHSRAELAIFHHEEKLLPDFSVGRLEYDVAHPDSANNGHFGNKATSTFDDVDLGKSNSV